MLKYFIIILIILNMTLVNGCVSGVNKSIYVRNGKTIALGGSTINGSIHVSDNCIVKGNYSTVNGKIRIGANCKVRSLCTVNNSICVGEGSDVDGKIGTVNGSVKCEEKVHVSESISTVNGSITCRKGVLVEGDLTNVNGHINLAGTVVKEITTNTGDITLTDKTIVERDIIIRQSQSSKPHRELTIRISGDSVVKGDIINKDDELEVKVVFSEGGKVEGNIENADVIQN
jgi:predicted acyltransferase (DUF342 family)